MERQPYDTDLSDAEWARIRALLPDVCPRGRPIEVPRREIVNAILYVLRAGCAWRLLPHDLPCWTLVYWYFWTWHRCGLWERISAALRGQLRRAEGRETSPSASIINSQSVKTTETRGVRGYDAAKKVKGRKHHLVVDMLGLPLKGVVHAADIQDRDGARLVFEGLQDDCPRLRVVWGDGGYQGPKLGDWVQGQGTWQLHIVRRDPDAAGFEVVPKRSRRVNAPSPDWAAIAARARTTRAGWNPPNPGSTSPWPGACSSDSPRPDGTFQTPSYSGDTTQDAGDTAKEAAGTELT